MPAWVVRSSADMKYRSARPRRSTGDAGAVEERAVEALAGLGRDAAVAERARRREGADVAVGLVDLDRQPLGSVAIGVARVTARGHRLFEEQDGARAAAAEAGCGGEAVEEVGDRVAGSANCSLPSSVTR